MEGVLIERPDGSFAKFVFQEGLAYCYFFDAEKKPIDPDIDRVAIRIERRQPSIKTVMAVAISCEGMKGLRAPKFIKKPLIFRVNLSFMREGIDDPVEFYLFRYPDAMIAAESVTIFESEPEDRSEHNPFDLGTYPHK